MHAGILRPLSPLHIHAVYYNENTLYYRRLTASYGAKLRTVAVPILFVLVASFVISSRVLLPPSSNTFAMMRIVLVCAGLTRGAYAKL